MPYYDHIAKKWHTLTGAHGGAFKKYALNDLVLSKISGIAGRAVLELGAGNGYFMPLVLRRFSGQVASRIVITDQSELMLRLAQRSFKVAEAEYQVLDVRAPFPLGNDSFDLILANMIFNEITTPDLRRAVRECHRVLAPSGRLLATVIHPAFVKSLSRRGQLRPFQNGVHTMPGSEGLRLPVVPRSLKGYYAALEAAGFSVRTEDVHSTRQILAAKPGLQNAGKMPIAMLLECEKHIH